MSALDSTFGRMIPSIARPATASRSAALPAFTRTKTGLLALLAEETGQPGARGFLRGRLDAVLEVDDDRVGARGDRFLDPVRPVAGDVEPGERRDVQTAPCSRRPAISSGLSPSSPSTESVSAPCAPPVNSIRPGVSESRATMPGILTVPSLSSSTDAIVPVARKCGSATMSLAS